MIRASLNKYIKAQVTGLSDVYTSTPDLVLSDLVKPFVTISYLPSKQELWELGDAARNNVTRLLVTLYCNSFDEQLMLKSKLTNALETAKADIGGGVLEPGIKLYGLDDKLTTSDLVHYFSGQSNWIVPPQPVVYKNGATVPTCAYSINSTCGEITFGSSQLSTDDIRADYQAGYIDFQIINIVDMPITDIENITHKYNSLFYLETFFYIRTKGQKLF